MERGSGTVLKWFWGEKERCNTNTNSYKRSHAEGEGETEGRYGAKCTRGQLVGVHLVKDTGGEGSLMSDVC